MLTSVGTSFHAGTVSAAQQVRHPSVPEPPRRANVCFASTEKKIRPKKKSPFLIPFGFIKVNEPHLVVPFGKYVEADLTACLSDDCIVIRL